MDPTEGDCALGLRFRGDSLPGLVGGVEEPLPSVTVDLASEAVLGERWGRADGRVIFSRDYHDGRPFLRIEHDPALGYRVWADRHGTHLIAADGRHCSAAVPDPGWRGLKLLASQVMPLATTLHGREVMHAAGVVVEGHLIGIVAASGTGKSSTACRLIAGGASFFADDVLALEIHDAGVRAHPGPRLANVHEADLAAIPEPGRRRLGPPLGQSDKVHLSPPGFPSSMRLDALVFLSRRARAGATEVASLDDVGRRLLGNAFLSYLDPPERLTRQLEVASVIARSVSLISVEIGADDDPGVVARRIEEWVGQAL